MDLAWLYMYMHVIYTLSITVSSVELTKTNKQTKKLVHLNLTTFLAVTRPSCTVCCSGVMFRSIKHSSPPTLSSPVQWKEKPRLICCEKCTLSPELYCVHIYIIYMEILSGDGGSWTLVWLWLFYIIIACSFYKNIFISKST